MAGRVESSTPKQPAPIEIVPVIGLDAPGVTTVEVPALRNDGEGLAGIQRKLEAEVEIRSVEVDVSMARLSIRHDGSLEEVEVRRRVLLVARDQAIERHESRGSPLVPSRASWMTKLHPLSPLEMVGIVVAPAVAFNLFGLPTLGYVTAGAAALGVLAWQVVEGIGRTITLPAPGSSPSERRIDHLLEGIKRHRGELMKAAWLRVGSVVISLLPFAVIAAAVNLVFDFGSSGLVAMTLSGLVWKMLALLALGLVLTILYAVLGYLSTVKSDTAAHEITHELRMKVYEHVQNLPISFFDDGKKGAMLSELSEDVNGAEKIFEGARKLLEIAVAVVAVSVALIITAPPIAWLVILFIPLFIHVASKLQRMYYPLFKAWSDEGARLNAALSGSLEGVATIKSMGIEPEMLEEIRRASAAYADRGHAVTRFAGVLPPMLDILLMSSIGVTLLAGVLFAGSTLGPGAYAATVLLIQQLIDPLSDIGVIAGNINRGFAAYFRAMAPLSAPEDAGLQGAEVRRESLRGEIAYRDVSFTYSSGATVLRSLSLEFPAGKTTGIVGSTGSGKTTLAKLMLRFYDVSSGAILLDGRDIREIGARSLRRQVGVVSQDVFLFDGTVIHNLLLANPGARQSDVVRAAEQAGAHDFIEALPQGYRTVVGERGVKLSGGQRQRIAIARALLRDPPILLFDEATSHVDNLTEASIQRSLERVFQGRTVIVIAHRLSTVQRADNIYVLKGGRVVESGSHDELRALGGDYDALWRLQIGSTVV